MSTRSVIAIKNADNTITGVYAHFDGYLEHNGKILFENYSDNTKLHKLIEQGAISILKSRIGRKHKFGADTDSTTFYHRDRGEALRVSTWKNEKQMILDMSACEYFYVFEDNTWKYSKGDEFYNLEEALQKLRKI